MRGRRGSSDESGTVRRSLFSKAYNSWCVYSKAYPCSLAPGESGPGCPACGTAKAYLRRRGIGFREVDVSKDRHAADRLIARSGQMAVPQIDVDGHLVVGFSRTRLDELLR